jgi:C4-dicarboxylate-specific signal transduction histidine kinase
MTVFLVFQGGLSSPGLIFFPCLSVIFTYILGKWAGIFWAIYSMLLVGALYWAESAGITLPTMGLPINPDLLRTVGTLAFVSFTLVFALYYEKTRVDSYRTIVEQQQALLQSSKMAALGEMAGGVAHEINNPLAIIQFNADFAKKALGSDPLQRERIVKSLEMIQGTSQRINSIIKGLMNFSKEGSEEELASVSVAQLIRDTLGLCSEKFKAHGIDLSVHEITDSITVQVRPSQISQVLLNLLSNAYDAISGCEGRWIRIESRAHGKTIQISVTDSGGGIATKDRERLFEPFFTTKPVGSGTGLGLSISQGLIESHGGRLFLDESSEHTRFTIELPLGQQL